MASKMKNLYELKMYYDVKEAEKFFSSEYFDKQYISYHLQKLETSLEGFKNSKTFKELEEEEFWRDNYYKYSSRRPELVNAYFKASDYVIKLKIMKESDKNGQLNIEDVLKHHSIHLKP